MTTKTDNKEPKVQLSNDEISRFEKCFKEEKFRDMFMDYMKEIKDPKNLAEQRKYIQELEVRQLETGKQTGNFNDHQVIIPIPAFVVKAFIDYGGDNPTSESMQFSHNKNKMKKQKKLQQKMKKKSSSARRKVFVNICSSDKIAKFERIPHETKLQYKVPLSLSATRPTKDKKGIAATVVDIVYNPETIKKADEDYTFKKYIINIALTWINDKYKLNVNTKDYATPKLTCKGDPAPQTIRISKAEKGALDKLYSRAKTQEQANKASSASSSTAKKPKKSAKNEKNKTASSAGDPMDALTQAFTNAMRDANEPKPINIPTTTKAPDKQLQFEEIALEPKCQIVHRGYIDFGDYTNERMKYKRRGIPKELVVRITLPDEMKSIKNVELDISSEYINLSCDKPLLKLEKKLPFPVDENQGGAKFFKKRHLLEITLPVVPNESDAVAVEEEFVPDPLPFVEEITEPTKPPVVVEDSTTSVSKTETDTSDTTEALLKKKKELLEKLAEKQKEKDTLAAEAARSQREVDMKSESLHLQQAKKVQIGKELDKLAKDLPKQHKHIESNMKDTLRQQEVEYVKNKQQKQKEKSNTKTRRVSFKDEQPKLRRRVSFKDELPKDQIIVEKQNEIFDIDVDMMYDLD